MTASCVLHVFVPLTPPPLPTGLSDRLALIIGALRGVIAAHMAKDRSAVEVLFLAWTRLGRLASRFESLVAAVRSGGLSSVRATREGSAADLELPRLEGLPQPFRLPSGFGWLLPLVPGSAAYAGQVEHLLADPEMAALLAGAPQAGRILRPLCRMLGIRPGPELLPPAPTPPPSPVPAEANGPGPASVRYERPSDGAAARAISPGSPLQSGLGAGSETSPAPAQGPELPVLMPGDPGPTQRWLFPAACT
ncbi:MAG: hypothetical protein JO110_14375 [Acetobacteraceae bacterium]|nr:hypothetical protein [Acetobacteraceae bacterium]